MTSTSVASRQNSSRACRTFLLRMSSIRELVERCTHGGNLQMTDVVESGWLSPQPMAPMRRQTHEEARVLFHHNQRRAKATCISKHSESAGSNDASEWHETCPHGLLSGMSIPLRNLLLQGDSNPDLGPYWLDRSKTAILAPGHMQKRGIEDQSSCILNVGSSEYRWYGTDGWPMLRRFDLEE